MYKTKQKVHYYKFTLSSARKNRHVQLKGCIEVTFDMLLK